jgi:ketosteroid isomerase-like protein
MDDVYAIHIAKTQYVTAFNSGDCDGLKAVISDNFLDTGHLRPTQGGEDARQELRRQIEQLRSEYAVELAVTPWFVQLAGDVAYALGVETWKLTPKSGGTARQSETRYLEIWRREGDGQWRLHHFMDNPNPLPAPVRGDRPD